MSELEALRQAQHDKEMPDQVRHDNIGRFRKIIAFADEEAASFTGDESWYAGLKDNFNIEFILSCQEPFLDRAKTLIRSHEMEGCSRTTLLSC